MTVKFNHSSDAAVQRIVERAMSLNPSADRLSLMMDLMAANGVNGNEPIDLEALAGADDSNLAHDVFGISRHINRETGRVEGHFLPRFSCTKSAA